MERSVLLKTLLFSLSIAFIGILIYHHSVGGKTKTGSEGFTQLSPFVLKQNKEAFDQFYSEIHDQLHLPKRRVPYEIENILKTTQASPASGVILDVGSGTGEAVNELTSLGYKTIGVDNSKDMVNESISKYPDILIKHDNVENMFIFNRSTFTHILCMYHTIYYFKDKDQVFRNFYYWMKPGGCLAVHLVDKQKYNKTVPAGKDILFGGGEPADQVIEFADFKYKAKQEVNKKTNETLLVETFVDATTDKIRQNEITMYIEEMDVIIRGALSCGFIATGSFSLKESTNDPFQYVYLFERPQSL